MSAVGGDFGRHAGLTPRLDVATDANGRIQGIQITWYMYQGGPPLYYCPAAANDIAAVFQILGAHAELFLDRSLSPPRRYESSVLPPSNATDIVPAQDWYLGPNGPADAHPDNIGIALSFPSPGGVAHFFNFPQLPEPVGSPATAGLPIPSYTAHGHEVREPTPPGRLAVVNEPEWRSVFGVPNGPWRSHAVP